jgi:UDP-2,3-diacylglucosamine pyrophosphatase LpxH
MLARTTTERLQLVRDLWRQKALRRLDRVAEASRLVTFGDSDRFVFLSDCHRGDNSHADEFTRNEDLFLHALSHYHDQGFTYVEVGDGDELWQNRAFGAIRKAHERSFDLLHRFNDESRLHLIVGNHDVRKGRCTRTEKDGLVAEEGLVLQYNGGGPRIVVTHGHQADFLGDDLRRFSRSVARFWKLMLIARSRRQRAVLSGLQSGISLFDTILDWIHGQAVEVERRIMEWVETSGQMIICGHTHRPFSAAPGETPYFNTGSCIQPGQITALELVNGELSLVRWIYGLGHPNAGLSDHGRQVIAPARSLSQFAW